MCGIVGYVGAGNVDALESAMRAIAHRGPDDSGLFVDPFARVGLGHVRLSIIDLSPLGHQPMEALGGNVQLVFNGEIYNYRELRRELEAKGVAFRGTSDTEVLLQLYLAEGHAMLPRLNGIFAFAIFDRSDQSVFLARDQLGVKPLYYAATQAAFAFCSEIKGLLELQPGLRDLDIVSLHRYLSFLYCPGNGTPLRDVRKLGPGEAMVVRDAKIARHWKWYELPIVRGVAQDLSVCDAIAGTVGNIRQAVHRQLVSDTPVGAFLSGGLDSSAVVAFAREQVPDLQCFTIAIRGGVDSGATDDLPYARMVAKHLRVPLEVVAVDADTMAGDLEEMVAALDEPLADPAPLNVLYISRLARERGIKVMLSGAGGDDIFSGYRRHRALNLERYWAWLPKAVRRGIDRTAAGLNQQNTLFRKFAKATANAALNGDERIASYFLWMRERQLQALYTTEARDAIGATQAVDPLLRFLERAPANAARLDRMLGLEQQFFLPDHNLTYTDKMGMAAGVEIRVPLLDLDVVEFAGRIRPDHKQYGSEGKWVFKKAMEPHLPKAAIYRPKAGFGAPVRRWIQRDLRAMVADVLSPERLRRRGIFDPQAVATLIAGNDRGRLDAAYTILSLLTVELWCERFIDRPQRRTVMPAACNG